MLINKVHCLFEQSGTFKNEFIKLGIPAEDYDIQNEFGETDNVIDLFAEIRGGYNGEPSIFDRVGKDDLIMAFFPCTMFQAYAPATFQQKRPQDKNKDDLSKLEYVIYRHNKLNEFYEKISQMAHIAIKNGLRMIIENPYTQPHYLTTYWCIEPKLIDKNRKERGDYYNKPTQYWFINCEPEHNFIFEPQVLHQGWSGIDSASKNASLIGTSVETVRSMISPEYANRFIREQIMNGE